MSDAIPESRWCSSCRKTLPIDRFYKGTGFCRECMRLQRLRRAAINYEVELELQGGGCAICSQMPDGKRLSVDHDHRTGLFRGLLCDRCNTLLGKADDNALVLRAAIDYLAKPGRRITLREMPRRKRHRHTFPVVVSRRETPVIDARQLHS